MIGVLYCTHDIVQHASAPETVHDSRQTKKSAEADFPALPGRLFVELVDLLKPEAGFPGVRGVSVLNPVDILGCNQIGTAAGNVFNQNVANMNRCLDNQIFHSPGDIENHPFIDRLAGLA